jgi:type III restriction enzyme
MAKSVIIKNPIINSPFEEPCRHYRFDDEGITDEIANQRRVSAYFVPIAQPRKKSKEKQLTLADWTADRIEENKTVNFVRQRVQIWREGGYPAITNVTRRLLQHWKNQDVSVRPVRGGTALKGCGRTEGRGYLSWVRL